MPKYAVEKSKRDAVHIPDIALLYHGRPDYANKRLNKHQDGSVAGADWPHRLMIAFICSWFPRGAPDVPRPDPGSTGFSQAGRLPAAGRTERHHVPTSPFLQPPPVIFPAGSGNST